jgi:hypothetical protein
MGSLALANSDGDTKFTMERQDGLHSRGQQGLQVQKRSVSNHLHRHNKKGRRTASNLGGEQGKSGFREVARGKDNRGTPRNLSAAQESANMEAP